MFIDSVHALIVHLRRYVSKVFGFVYDVGVLHGKPFPSVPSVSSVSIQDGIVERLCLTVCKYCFLLNAVGMSTSKGKLSLTIGIHKMSPREILV